MHQACRESTKRSDVVMEIMMGQAGQEQGGNSSLVINKSRSLVVSVVLSWNIVKRWFCFDVLSSGVIIS